jgi:hypothetical protein
MSQFKPGDPRTKTGGRRKGSRDRIETSLLEAIASDFALHGEEAIRIARLERPHEYLRLVASLLPREVEAKIDGNVEVTHQIEHIKRTIIDPKVVTVQQPVRLLPKAPTVEPEPKADFNGLYE